MNDGIDWSVYPDLDRLPDALESDRDRADYVARICGAWDFGVTPTPETFVLFAAWADIFEAYPIYGSPAFEAFRSLYGLPPLAGNRCAEADYERIDLDRPHPCVDMI